MWRRQNAGSPALGSVPTTPVRPVVLRMLLPLLAAPELSALRTLKSPDRLFGNGSLYRQCDLFSFVALRGVRVADIVTVGSDVPSTFLPARCSCW